MASPTQATTLSTTTKTTSTTTVSTSANYSASDSESEDLGGGESSNTDSDSSSPQTVSQTFISKNKESFVFNTCFNSSSGKIADGEGVILEGGAPDSGTSNGISAIVNYLHMLQALSNTAFMLLIRVGVLYASATDQAVEIYNERSSEWTTCCFLSTELISAEEGFVRICVPYVSLGIGEYPRSPIKYQDYIPEGDIPALKELATLLKNTTRQMHVESKTHLHLNDLSLRSSNSSEVGDNASVNASENASENAVENAIFVDLLFLQSETYGQNCNGNVLTSEHCFAMCCLSVYMESPFCQDNSLSCV